MDEPTNTVPKKYMCLISGKILFEPVKAKDGYTYEKEVIEQYIKDGKNSPISNQRLYLNDLQEDMTTKVMIEEYLERFPEHKAEVYLPDYNRKALLEAIKSQDIASIKAMLKKDDRFYKQPLEKGRNIFHLVCESGTYNLFSELLTFLRTEKMLDTMIQAKRPDGWNPVRLNEKLQFCIKKGDTDLNELESLLALGADLQTKSSTGKSLIHLAIESKQMEIVKILIKKGLVCTTDEGQPSPLIHIAVGSKDGELIDLILNSKISLDVKNANGVTVLHKAILAKDMNLIKYLLEKGANPNAPDSLGNTSLHLALHHKLPEEIVLLLIQHRAYYKERNHDGKRPIDLVNNPKFLYAMERTHKNAKQQELQKLYTRIHFLEEKVRIYEQKEKVLPEKNNADSTIKLN